MQWNLREKSHAQRGESPRAAEEILLGYCSKTGGAQPNGSVAEASMGCGSSWLPPSASCRG
jgi:hypothetical protein